MGATRLKVEHLVQRFKYWWGLNYMVCNWIFFFKKVKKKYILFSFSIKMRKCTWVELLRNPFLQVLSGFDKPLYCWLKVVLSNISVSFVMTGSTATVQRNLHCEIVEWDIERNPSEKDLQFKRLLWRGVWKNKKKKQTKNKMICFLMREREPDNCISISFLLIPGVPES